jgi:flagellar capping protein FliD
LFKISWNPNLQIWKIGIQTFRFGKLESKPSDLEDFLESKPSDLENFLESKPSDLEDFLESKPSDLENWTPTLNDFQI